MIATDALSLVFIFCFLLGFGFFLLTALLGSHGHAHTHGVHAGGHVHAPAIHHTTPHVSSYVHTHTHTTAHQQAQSQHPQGNFSLFAYLNPMSIALFLLGFGFVGYFFHNLTNLAVSLTLILASGGGLIIATLLLLALNRIFANAEGSTEQDVVDRTGMIGKVSITIPEKGLGEIIYLSPGGMRKSIAARSLDGQRLERDQEVVVVNYQQGVAEVDTWEHFMHEETRSPDPSTFEELVRLRALLNEAEPGEIEMVMRQEPQKD
ncbi:MAG TPA: hypothetical protein VFV38_11170 [Ktedonobacteraceae bacterium]|nr:hypothetical protein [Ktedonobacteraceae bacterium]